MLAESYDTILFAFIFVYLFGLVWFRLVLLLLLLLFGVPEFDAFPGRSEAGSDTGRDRGRPGPLATLEKHKAHDPSGQSANGGLDEGLFDVVFDSNG